MQRNERKGAQDHIRPFIPICIVPRHTILLDMDKLPKISSAAWSRRRCTCSRRRCTCSRVRPNAIDVPTKYIICAGELSATCIIRGCHMVPRRIRLEPQIELCFDTVNREGWIGVAAGFHWKKQRKWSLGQLFFLRLGNTQLTKSIGKEDLIRGTSRIILAVPLEI